jgi:glycosyltransferase involved in cell wall biosynthesis
MKMNQCEKIENPKISVLMSVYNENFTEIEESIKSVLEQSFSEFEFIIINDNPNRKDLSSFLHTYHRSDDRIIVLENSENIGLARSMNYAASVARAGVLARMQLSIPGRIVTFSRAPVRRHIYSGVKLPA